MARSLNKATLIGNLTRDPELRYTPQGTAVCTFSLATNRQWTTDSGEKKEDAEFHRIVAWNKLAEICAQLLKKGRKVFVEGRLQTRNWTGQDGAPRSTTEVVISDMILLDSRRDVGTGDDFDVPDSALGPQEPVSQDEPAVVQEKGEAVESKTKKTAKKQDSDQPKGKSEPPTEDNPEDDDIPF
jgi:single-strand DNA-binding protein